MCDLFISQIELKVERTTFINKKHLLIRLLVQREYVIVIPILSHDKFIELQKRNA